MKKYIFLLILFLPLTLMAETWEFPMGGNTLNSKIAITQNSMSINWDDFNGNHIDYTFDKGDSFYSEDKSGDWKYSFYSAKRGNILFMYADLGDGDGVLLILDASDKTSNPWGKELMKVGVDADIFIVHAQSKCAFSND